MAPPLQPARALVGSAASFTQRALASSLTTLGTATALHTLPGSALATGLDALEHLVTAGRARSTRPPRARGPLNPEDYDRWLKAALPLEVAVCHPSFARALLATHLHKRLAFYGHPITDASGAPQLLVDGEAVSWPALARRFSFERGSIREKATGAKYDYLENGLVPWDYIQWKEIRPFRTLPEGERPETHALEVVSRPSRVQDFHAWIRLITPEGAVYSVGLRARALPFSGYGPIAQSTRAQLTCPDIEEFFAGDDQRVVRLPLSAEKFDEIRARLAQYQSAGLHFNYVDHNCSTFTSRIAADAGAHFEVDASPLEILTPGPARDFIDAHVPRPIRGAAARAMGYLGYLGPNMFENAMLVLAGGTLGLHPDGSEKDGTRGASLAAIIQHPMDLLGPSKLRISWPGRLKAWQAGALATPPGPGARPPTPGPSSRGASAARKP